MNLFVKTFECDSCGAEIEIDYSEIKCDDRCKCQNCNTIFSIDTDAEFEDGRWVDKTKLWRV